MEQWLKTTDQDWSLHTQDPNTWTQKRDAGIQSYIVHR